MVAGARTEERGVGDEYADGDRLAPCLFGGVEVGALDLTAGARAVIGDSGGAGAFPKKDFERGIEVTRGRELGVIVNDLGGVDTLTEVSGTDLGRTSG